MSRYVMIRRLRGPACLLLVGVNALLNQAHILNWGHSWPFYLILWGVLSLAERAALASEGYPQWPGGTPYQGQPYPGQSYPGQPYSGQPYAGAPPQGTAAPESPISQSSNAIVPAGPHDLNKGNGGQS